jgi:hypothetical protein
MLPDEHRVGRKSAQRMRHGEYVAARRRGLRRSDAMKVSGVSKATAKRIDRKLRADGFQITTTRPTSRPQADLPADDGPGPSGVKLSRGYADLEDFDDALGDDQPVIDQALEQAVVRTDLAARIESEKVPNDGGFGDFQDPITGGFGDPMPADHPAQWPTDRPWGKSGTWSPNDTRFYPDDRGLSPSEARFMELPRHVPEEEPLPGSRAWNARAARLRKQRSSPKPYSSFLGVVGN